MIFLWMFNFWTFKCDFDLLKFTGKFCCIWAHFNDWKSIFNVNNSQFWCEWLCLIFTSELILFVLYTVWWAIKAIWFNYFVATKKKRFIYKSKGHNGKICFHFFVLFCSFFSACPLNLTFISKFTNTSVEFLVAKSSPSKFSESNQRIERRPLVVCTWSLVSLQMLEYPFRWLVIHFFL